MNDDIVNLINEYKNQLIETENAIKAVNERYANIIGYTFVTYDAVVYFVNLLSKPISRNVFICLSNRCPLCANEYSNGFYSYTDEAELTIASLLEFCKYLRQENIMCEHECVDNIQVSDIMCTVNLKCQPSDLENSDQT